MIHDDDIAEGLPATVITETRRYFPGLANTYLRSLVKEEPATVGLVKRGDDGFVSAVAVTRERDSKPIYFVRPVDDDGFVPAASAIRLLPHQRDVVWKLGGDVLELGDVLPRQQHLHHVDAGCWSRRHALRVRQRASAHHGHEHPRARHGVPAVCA